MIKIVIVEDQNMLRDSLTFTINSQNNMRVVASLSDAADALEAVKRTNADLVLMDVCTENDSGDCCSSKNKADYEQRAHHYYDWHARNNFY